MEQRNSMIFDRKQPTVLAWKAVLKHDIGLTVHRVKAAHKGAYRFGFIP
jgi:hypothetical protein